MLLACFVGQQPIGGSEHMEQKCLNCNDVTHFARKFCALCSIREEMGEITLKYPEVNIVYG